MRIVTLNTWKNEGHYARRLALMARGLAALAPDVVCLQECFAGAGLDTAASLAQLLGLHCHARPARAKLRGHEGGMVASTSGLAILTRRPAEGEAACELDGHFADGERIAQRADLILEDGPLRILNLHLTHLRGPGSSELRASQLAAALEWADAGPTVGLVVAGDLNASLGDPALAALNAQVGLDAPTFLGPRSDGFPATGGAIDHLILQTPGNWCMAARFRALDAADPDGWHASDHAAVAVDLRPAYSR